MGYHSKLEVVNMAKGIVIFLALVVIGIVLGVAVANKGGTTGNVVASSSLQQGADQLKVFEGKITNAKLPPGRLEGVSLTDKGCYGVGGGLVECNTDIETNQGSINFIYKHNMNIQPCLSMYGKEPVIVDIIDANGNAKVTRTIDITDSMSSMH